MAENFGYAGANMARFGKFLFFVAAAALAVYGWNRWNHPVASPSDTDSPAYNTVDDNGFMRLPPASGQESDTVYVVAAGDSPADVAQRTEALVENLKHDGIPVVRANGADFQPASLAGTPEGTEDNVNRLLSGKLPLVFINGRAKGNATLSEVEAEFNKVVALKSPT